MICDNISFIPLKKENFISVMHKEILNMQYKNLKKNKCSSKIQYLWALNSININTFIKYYTFNRYIKIFCIPLMSVTGFSSIAAL